MTLSPKSVPVINERAAAAARPPATFPAILPAGCGFRGDRAQHSEMMPPAIPI
jgi:hypothetical protein